MRFPDFDAARRQSTRRVSAGVPPPGQNLLVTCLATKDLNSPHRFLIREATFRKAYHHDVGYIQHNASVVFLPVHETSPRQPALTDLLRARVDCSRGACHKAFPWLRGEPACKWVNSLIAVALKWARPLCSTISSRVTPAGSISRETKIIGSGQCKRLASSVRMTLCGRIKQCACPRPSQLDKAHRAGHSHGSPTAC